MVTIKQKSKVIDVPIFQAEFLLIYFRKTDYANKVLAKAGFSQRLDPTDAGMVTSEDIEKEDKTVSKKFVIIINHNDDYDQLKNIIAHECLHLTQEILEARGITFKKGAANETYTYFNSWLQGVVEKFIG